MKKRVIGSIVSLVFLILIWMVYWIRTSNIDFIKPIGYKDIFDYPYTEWICEKPYAELKVYNIADYPELAWTDFQCPAIMNVEIDGEKKSFIAVGGHSSWFMFDINKEKNGQKSDYDIKFKAKADFKKNFFSGEVSSFDIYNIKEDKIFNGQYEKMIFKKKEND